MLTAAERRALLALARRAVADAAAGLPSELPPGLPSALLAPGAAFVTLHRDGELRGCIGHVAARQPLAESVLEMARAAATEDDRFEPVAVDEVPLLEIEISAISPMRRVAPADVVVGRDGLQIRLGARSGLLLPQVAVDHAWDVPTFLVETCRKAGLPADAWSAPGAELLAFTAEVFGEENL